MGQKTHVTAYLHSSKDSMWDLGSKIGLSEQVIAQAFKFTLSEVEFELEVDLDTGESEILLVNGRPLGERKK